jgi:hypothetical protein
MITKKIFLASSAELKEDRGEFEVFISRKNKDWVAKGVFLELVIWEDFLDAMSQTRLQDEYDKAIRESDLFVMLFWTKVGQYTEEEFETAFGQFKTTNKPFIFTYFKDAEISVANANKKDLMSLWAFQEKLSVGESRQTHQGESPELDERLTPKPSLSRVSSRWKFPGQISAEIDTVWFVINIRRSRQQEGAT